MLNGAIAPIEVSEPNSVGQAHSTARVAYLAVKGMHTVQCARRVRNALFALDGVLSVDILLDFQEAIVGYDLRWVTPGDLIATLARVEEDEQHHHYAAQLLRVATAEEALVV